MLRQLLASGKVSVNHAVEIDGQIPVTPFDLIQCESNILQNKHAYYIMLNKPIGVVSATTDEQHKTVIDCINEPFADQLHIAGRLDLNTSGLVILTNDGQFSRKITQPEEKIGKKYEVGTENTITDEYIKYFAKGMFFDYEQVQIQPAILKIRNNHNAQLTIFEGRYHQVKRMFARFQNKVISLHRTSMGAIELDKNLRAGEYRFLSETEVNSI
ncbi:16S rRNA pseudouridine(516) synthase [Marinicellulosiphila megalodicopiae]|uniref:16S rRNA pseudouridine(516) synthase n=1 Tax=Marinicellulosiphila megalodicopiae TaxID=2724896 RepID=UPI003BAF28A4